MLGLAACLLAALPGCRRAPVLAANPDWIVLPPAAVMTDSVTHDLAQGADSGAIVPTEYRLGAGDVLNITYTFGPRAQTKDFIVRPGDQLSISFLETPNYNRTISVRPDGRASLPSIGEVELAGKSISAIEDELRDSYVDILAQPTLDVQLLSSYSGEDALRNAVTSMGQGSVREHVVRPDGYISLPLLGDVRAESHTPAELAAALNKAYAAAGVNNVQVSASLSAATSSVVYVMGEVQNQGKLPLSGRVNLWRLVANAGGFTANADRRHVTVLRMAADGSEVRTVYDFEAWRAGQTVNKGDVLIQPGDMVYVPVQTQRYVYVTGEVETPRQILLDSDVTMTASQALTMGGGAMLRGDDGRVLLLRKTAANEPLVTELDIKALFEAETYLNGPSPADPVLAAGDILYVPTSAVGDLNKFAARWFRDGFWTILPFSANASYQRGDFNTKSDPN